MTDGRVALLPLHPPAFRQTNMETFIQEHPEYGRPLLTFALEYLLANKWPGNSLMHDLNSCDESCEVGESCGCTCNVDPFEMSDDEVKNDDESNGSIVWVGFLEGGRISNARHWITPSRSVVRPVSNIVS